MNMNIGNTPMIKIKYEYNGKQTEVFVKLEYYNITGSIKDRVATYIIKEAYNKGQLKDGMEIVEATSGNTGIALAAIGAYLKHPVHIFMPDWVSEERKILMQMYNAKVTLISKKEGGFKEAIRKAREYSKKNKAFYCNQFDNINNVLAHYETTAEEIINQTGEGIGGFVSGIGTGGTIIGIGKRLKEKYNNIKIYALEPEKMPIMTQNKVITKHKIEGIGDEFIPKIVDRSIIDKIFLINDEDSINMSRKLALELGIGVGISSGANMIASVLSKEENNKKIVTVFPDDNKKYLTTDLANPIKNNKEFISNKISLIDYEFIR